MGRLIVIMGNSGSGKTTLANQLCSMHQFMSGFEQHAERSYHSLFAHASGDEKLHLALANQIDFLLLRAEQELAIRDSVLDGVLDGGLEMDFHVFTRLFLHRGYLDQADFLLCERFYRFIRKLLPVPDQVIFLDTPLELVRQRYIQRHRSIEITRLGDLELIQNYLQEWLLNWTASPVLTVDASRDDPGFIQTSQRILRVMYPFL